MNPDIILQARGLGKTFGSFAAVSDVNLDIQLGSIHALIGPNGAGKTTCFNLLTGFVRPTSGQVLFKGLDIATMAPAKIAQLGLVRSFQISAVFPQLTALGNVRIALQRQHGSCLDFWRSNKILTRHDEAALALLEEVGLSDAADQLASSLSYGRRRALEIATTLALDPEVMLLDEPLAGMGQEDIGRIAQLIKRLARKRTIVMVEHNLNVVATICDRITVLARGRVLAEGDYATLADDPLVRETYLGGDDDE